MLLSTCCQYKSRQHYNSWNEVDHLADETNAANCRSRRGATLMAETLADAKPEA